MMKRNTGRIASVAMAAVMAGGLAILPGNSLAGDAVAGKTAFHDNCQRCHNPDADRATYGPELAGVVGRAAGSVKSYAYSEVLRNSGLVWTEAALKAWIADNDNMLPGIKMRHVGIVDPGTQDNIVAYLKTLK